MDALTAWSTLALALLALLALIVAGRQIAEARELRKSTSRAYVTVHAEGDKPTRVINLYLGNAGVTHAEDIEVTFYPPLEAAATWLDHSKTSSFWHQPVLPPGVRLHTALDSGPDRVDSNLPMRYQVSVSYVSPATSEKRNHTYELDLNAAAYAARHVTPSDDSARRRTEALQSIDRTLVQYLSTAHPPSG